MRRIFIALIFTMFTAGSLFAATPKVGDAATEIQAKDWLNASTPISLASMNKNIVVVQLWASTCALCVTSIPHLVELQEKYKDKGVVILGLSEEDKAKVSPIVSKLKIKYPVGIGSKSVQDYGVRFCCTLQSSTTVVVAPGGKIVWSGHPMNGLDKAVEKALVDTPPQK